MNPIRWVGMCIFITGCYLLAGLAGAIACGGFCLVILGLAYEFGILIAATRS